MVQHGLSLGLFIGLLVVSPGLEPGPAEADSDLNAARLPIPPRDLGGRCEGDLFSFDFVFEV